MRFILYKDSYVVMILQEKHHFLILLVGVICVFMLYTIHLNLMQNYAVKRILHIKSLALMKYNRRRNTIQEYCQKNQSKLSILNKQKIWNKALFYDYEHNLIFCPIHKVSSTTWTTNLLK